MSQVFSQKSKEAVIRRRKRTIKRWKDFVFKIRIKDYVNENYGRTAHDKTASGGISGSSGVGSSGRNGSSVSGSNSNKASIAIQHEADDILLHAPSENGAAKLQSSLPISNDSTRKKGLTHLNGGRSERQYKRQRTSMGAKTRKRVKNGNSGPHIHSFIEEGGEEDGMILKVCTICGFSFRVESF